MGHVDWLNRALRGGRVVWIHSTKARNLQNVLPGNQRVGVPAFELWVARKGQITTKKPGVNVSQRFSYVKYDDKAVEQQAELKAAFEGLEELVEKLENGRAKSLVLTKLEEAYMWTGKSIRDTQIARAGKIEEQPERNNE